MQELCKARKKEYSSKKKAAGELLSSREESLTDTPGHKNTSEKRSLGAQEIHRWRGASLPVQLCL